MTDTVALIEMERLLVMAAAVHGLGPNTPLTANAAKVVRQALQWAGLMNDEVREAWSRLEYHPAILDCYGTLIRMIRQFLQNDRILPPERLGEALFEGAGNFGTPREPRAFPDFTSCHLTEYGELVAKELLEQYPEYRQTR